MKIAIHGAAIAAVMALGGCLGGGSGDDSAPVGGTTTATTATTVAEALDTYEELQAKIDSGALTAVSELPTGSATMTGYLGVGDLGDDGDLTALGDMTLDVDFDGGSVTGSAENFALYNEDSYEKEEDVSGSLAIAGSISGVTLDANATGTLTDASGSTVDAALGMTGDFYDVDGTLTVLGDVDGTLTDDEGTFAVEGGFYAQE